MSNRNVDKGREAENAAARVLREAGMPHAERRTKRGGTVTLECLQCVGTGRDGVAQPGPCVQCQGAGWREVPADAGDLTGIPGVVVQVKWSGYKSLAEDMRRTDEQRRVAGADVGLLVRKRPRVGVARAAEWDAYLPTDQLAELIGTDPGVLPTVLHRRVWHTDLWTAAHLIACAGYGTPAWSGHAEAPSPTPA